MRTHWLTAAFIASLAAFFATPASAAVVSITQAKVNQGGVTPGDAPGFPVTISQSGSYRLDTNLDFTSAAAGKNGIEIRANDVTIDFNGFRLQGWLMGGTGVDGLLAGSNQRHFDTARITNGIVAGFRGTGILGGNFWIVEDMQVLVNTGHGVELLDNGRVQRNTVSGSGAWGVVCGGSCLVEKNIISGSRVGGASVASSTVLGNTISNNASYGLFARELSGYGSNTLHGNNKGNAQVGGNIRKLQPNVCEPACP